MSEIEVVYLDGEQETSNFVSRAGRAKVTYSNGDVFEGNFDDRRLKHGENCIYTFAPTSEEEEQQCVYTGEYTDGTRTGVGSMKYADGTLYRGQWVNGQRHGVGSYTYSNGDIYSGEWKEDQRSGKGTYVHLSSECRLDATWQAGQPISGEFTHPDNTKFSGSFDGSKYSGNFNLKFPTGISLQGEFYQRIIPRAGGEVFEDRWRPTNAETKESVPEHYVDHLLAESKWP